MLCAEVERLDRPGTSDTIGLLAVRRLIVFDGRRQCRVELRTWGKTQACAEGRDALAFGTELQRRAFTNANIGEIRPALPVPHQSAPKLRVEGIQRQEEVDRRAAPIVERNVVEKRLLLFYGGLDL
jgi:hypothetical protein